MQKQAKYLIDDMKFHVAGIATSWDYDNRISPSLTEPFPGVLADDGSGFGVTIKRDFQPQSAGKLAFEFWYSSDNADGVRLHMLSSDGRTLWDVTADEGELTFCGQKTGVPTAAGITRGKVSFDLDTHAAAFIRNGKTVGTAKLPDTKDVSRVVFGTTGSTALHVTPMKFRLTADFLANESFLCTGGGDGGFPEAWRLDGDFEIRTHTAANPQMDYTYAAVSAKGGSRHTALLPLARKAESDLACEGYFLLPEGADGASFTLMADGKDVFGVHTSDGAFLAPDGACLRRFTANVWQLVRFETSDSRVTVKIDGKVCGEFPFTPPENTPIDALCVSFAPSADGTLCFTDLVCEDRIEYSDYCPEPKTVRHPDYEVGVNVCNMWREGHHFGWDRITYFTDNTPLIGPYDEGNPEVADWEIKFMTEHGITYQHFCWYCPDPLINFPIKRSRMDSALRDGFMNARYSDKMKFIIMWENNGYRNTNPDDFKNYVWKYWCEYFFTDPRYLKIDNKPLLSLWSLKFIEHWGGEEQAAELVKFMNEDIKNYGCDGILLMATASASASAPDAARYRTMSDYCDITYAYHYGSDGARPEHQLRCIELLNALHESDAGMAPFMQTVSVGFNSAPWHGADARCPLISLEDYETVLRSVKRHGDESAGAWYDKLFMMSTWNEYGEGTYIMPSGIHGFGYLDKIREVFVPESGVCDNLLPDENQNKRLCTLRIPDRVMIRRLGFEPSEEGKAPNTVTKAFDFSRREDTAFWRGFNGAVESVYTGDRLDLRITGSHEHYSLISASDAPLCKAGEVSHIRLRVRSRAGASRIRLAFLTDTDKRWASSKCTKNMALPASEEYAELLFYPGKFETWIGEITDIRIDNMEPLPLEIAGIDFMTYAEPPEGDPAVFVRGEKMRLAFQPRLAEDGSMLVSLDPGTCGFRAFALYHEYDRVKRQLAVASKDTEAVFTEGVGCVLVNGKSRVLKHPLAMRDGLPTLALDELCGIFGIPFRFDGKHLMIEDH